MFHSGTDLKELILTRLIYLKCLQQHRPIERVLLLSDTSQHEIRFLLIRMLSTPMLGKRFQCICIGMHVRHARACVCTCAHM